MPKFRIIAFDGGGIKGSLSTALLKRLCNAYPNLIKDTDLFTGASTGAIIAIALAYGININTIDNMYSFNNIKRIFTPKRLNLFKPKFSNKHLAEAFNSIIPNNSTIKDLKKYIFIPSFNVKGINKRHWQGIFFNNLCKNHYLDEKLINIALASSAAPTYFPSHNDFIDGGIITNSPGIASVIGVMKELPNKYKLEDFRVLSIGTGVTPKRIIGNTKNWGLLQWAFNPFSTVKLPLTSVLLNDTASLEHLLISVLLEKNYFRINPTLFKDIEIDDYKKVPHLKEMANSYDLKETEKYIENYYL
ncbi:MAG: hypothetical protein GX275_10105 [Clostridiales bacterium]|nr:hypothetical protein [Clostridiales bacterium]